MEQLRADASVPRPVLVAQSICRSGCHAVGCASSGICLVNIPIKILLLFYHCRAGGRVWNCPCTMTTAIFYGFFPRKQSTLEVLHRLGQIESMAVCHSCMSNLVGCSWGHLILEYASPGGRLKRISVLILLPDAVKISDINVSWREIRILLSWQSVSAAYSALSRTCMMNWLPCRGYSWTKSETTTFISKIGNFSYSIFIHEWVTKIP
jgi:hypothetical protein